ncbi:GtrA family protein [Paenibacillus sp. TRM 82003]|nr:GtrA family protein [Paenibacillus sp. TRM 82003]
MPKRPVRSGELASVTSFAVIGGMNALVDIAILNLLLRVHPTTDGGWLTTYNTIAYVCAVTNSYLWNARFTFRQRATFRFREKLWFAAQAGVALIVSNAVFLGCFQAMYAMEPLRAPVWALYNGAKGMAMALSSASSYFMMRYIVFSGKRGDA